MCESSQPLCFFFPILTRLIAAHQKLVSHHGRMTFHPTHLPQCNFLSDQHVSLCSGMDMEEKTRQMKLKLNMYKQGASSDSRLEQDYHKVQTRPDAGLQKTSTWCLVLIQPKGHTVWQALEAVEHDANPLSYIQTRSLFGSCLNRAFFFKTQKSFSSC